jgi:Tol biopolymer transport system component
MEGCARRIIAALWIATRDTVPAITEWSEPRRITSDDGLTFQPTISRDGTLIAYSSDRAGKGNLDIWVQQTAGGAPIQVTFDPADDSHPHFSPDGRSIAFRSSRDDGGVYVVPSLGGFNRLVAARGHRPRFSPDGKFVSYSVARQGASSWLSPLHEGEL